VAVVSLELREEVTFVPTELREEVLSLSGTFDLSGASILLVDLSAGGEVEIVWVEAGSFQWRSEILRCQKFSVPLHLTTFTY